MSLLPLVNDEEPEVAGILTDLMRRETTTTSHAFTGTLLDYMKKSTGMSREPHRHAAFRVLRAPDSSSSLMAPSVKVLRVLARNQFVGLTEPMPHKAENEAL